MTPDLKAERRAAALRVGDVVNTPEGVGLLEAISRNKVENHRYLVSFKGEPDRLWRYGKDELALIHRTPK